MTLPSDFEIFWSSIVQVAVDEELPRHLVARGEQQRRPVDAVEAKDVLGQQVVHRGPEPLDQVLAARAYVSALR